MFFNTIGKATDSKKRIYLSASTILGIELSIIVYSWIGMAISSRSESLDAYISLGGNDFVFLIGLIFLNILGAIGGFYLGRFWWRKLYIERVWEKK